MEVKAQVSNRGSPKVSNCKVWFSIAKVIVVYTKVIKLLYNVKIYYA